MSFMVLCSWGHDSVSSSYLISFLDFQYNVLMKLARIDQNQSIMMEEIKQLGRRTEPSHARIHFEKIDTIDAFIEFDAKLKDDREFRNLTV